MKLTGWEALHRFSAVHHRLCCKDRGIRAGAIDRLGCILARLNDVVNGKLFNLFLMAALAVAVICFLLPSRGFSDRQQVSYVSVQVVAGDTVWQIAARHVTATENIQEMIIAIRQANNLNNNAKVYPGQVLKVPVIGPAIHASRVDVTR